MRHSGNLLRLSGFSRAGCILTQACSSFCASKCLKPGHKSHPGEFVTDLVARWKLIQSIAGCWVTKSDDLLLSHLLASAENEEFIANSHHATSYPLSRTFFLVQTRRLTMKNLPTTKSHTTKTSFPGFLITGREIDLI